MSERRIRDRVVWLIGVPVLLVSVARSTSSTALLASASETPADPPASGTSLLAGFYSASAASGPALDSNAKAELEPRGMAQESAPAAEIPSHPALSDRFFFGFGAYF